ncbi:MAG TPA: hypothetical protein DCZ20_11585 [Lachnospiraceae bacterium]|nr:hypothetical protein [Lachnospiraceae bacterium]
MPPALILLFIVLAFMVVLSWFVPVSTVTFSDTGGRNIHPGMARNRMKNAVLLAQKFIACLPENETPSSTENYEGYYNITDILGSIDQCVMTCHIRIFFPEGITVSVSMNTFLYSL